MGEDGAVRAFVEKPPEKCAGLIIGGVCLLDRQVAETIADKRAVSLETELFPHFDWPRSSCGGGEGPFLDIGAPETCAMADEFFLQGDAEVTQRRFVLLDRDGTVIVERHYLSDPCQVELIPGAASALRHLRKTGLGLAIITNQSPIGRGLFSEECLDLIHHRLLELLEAEGVYVDGIYYCPHLPEENCRCRKPQPGLVELAAEELHFDPQASFLVGDNACDIELGRRVGATTLLVRTGYGAQAVAAGAVTPDYVGNDLLDATHVIRHLLSADEGVATDAAGR